MDQKILNKAKFSFRFHLDFFNWWKWASVQSSPDHRVAWIMTWMFLSYSHHCAAVCSHTESIFTPRSMLKSLKKNVTFLSKCLEIHVTVFYPKSHSSLKLLFLLQSFDCVFLKDHRFCVKPSLWCCFNMNVFLSKSRSALRSYHLLRTATLLEVITRADVFTEEGV